MKWLVFAVLIVAAFVVAHHYRDGFKPPLPSALAAIECSGSKAYAYASLDSTGLFLPCEDAKAKATLEQEWRQNKITHTAPIGGFAYILNSDNHFEPDSGRTSTQTPSPDEFQYRVIADFMARGMRYSAPLFENGPFHQLRNIVVSVPHALAKDGPKTTFQCDLPPDSTYSDPNGGYRCAGEVTSEELHWEIRLIFSVHMIGVDASEDIVQALDLIAAHVRQ